jgi:hypothetical protein
MKENKRWADTTSDEDEGEARVHHRHRNNQEDDIEQNGADGPQPLTTSQVSETLSKGVFMFTCVTIF